MGQLGVNRANVRHPHLLSEAGIPANISNRIAYLDGELVAVQLGNDVRMLRDCLSDVELRVRTQLMKPPSGKSTRPYQHP